jgi:hypothetical protein
MGYAMTEQLSLARQQLAALKTAMEANQRDQKKRSSRYWKMHDMQRELEHQIRDEFAESVWMELPERVRSLFVKDEGDIEYRIGEYKDGLSLSYNPVNFSDERAERFHLSFTLDRIRDAYALLGTVIDTFAEENTS